MVNRTISTRALLRTLLSPRTGALTKRATPEGCLAFVKPEASTAGLPCLGGDSIILCIGCSLMADTANRYNENTGGKYYVDNQCIDCDLCRETAPDNFKPNDDGGFSFVFKKPQKQE